MPCLWQYLSIIRVLKSPKQQDACLLVNLPPHCVKHIAGFLAIRIRFPRHKHTRLNDFQHFIENIAAATSRLELLQELDFTGTRCIPQLTFLNSQSLQQQLKKLTLCNTLWQHSFDGLATNQAALIDNIGLPKFLNLQGLNLSDNKLRMSQLLALLKSLPVSLKLNLQTLHLNKNHLGAQISIIGTTGLEGLKNLQELYLEDNQLRMLHLGLLNLRCLANLKKLHLNNNRLSVFSAIADQAGIISSIGLAELATLQVLDLSNNQLSMKQLSFIKWQCLANLSKLWLNNNQLGVFLATDDQVTIISNTRLAALKNLQWLNLSDNQLTLAQLALLNLQACQSLSALDLSAMTIEAAASSDLLNTAIAACGATTILACAKLQQLSLGFTASSTCTSESYLSDLLHAMTKLTATTATPKLWFVSIANPLPVALLKQFFANPAIFAAAKIIHYRAPGENNLALLQTILATAPQLQEISVPKFITAIIDSTTSYKLICTAARDRPFSANPVLYFNRKHQKHYLEVVALLNQAKQYKLNKFAALFGLLELLLVDSNEAKQQLELMYKSNKRQMLLARTIMADHTIKLTSSFALPGLLQQEGAQLTVARNQAMNNIIAASWFLRLETKPHLTTLLTALDLLLMFFMRKIPCQIICIAIASVIMICLGSLLGLYWDISACVKQQTPSVISQHHIKIKHKLFWRGSLYLMAHFVIPTLTLLLPQVLAIMPEVQVCILVIWLLATPAAHCYLMYHAASNYSSWGKLIAASIEDATDHLAVKRRETIIAEFVAPEPAAPHATNETGHGLVRALGP